MTSDEVKKELTEKEWERYELAVHYSDDKYLKENNNATLFAGKTKRTLQSLALVRRQLRECQAKSEERRKMLAKHQWHWESDKDGHIEDYYCPECGQAKHTGHAPDCQLAKLAREEG